MEKLTQVLHRSEFIEISRRDDGYYIESFKPGFSMDALNRILGSLPEIQIQSFITIRNIILNAPVAATKFGEQKARILVDVSSDELQAYITLNVDPNELTEAGQPKIVREIIETLNARGIVYGIKNDVLHSMITSGKKILIAQGLEPENGQDSCIRMYEIIDPKPELKDDGNVDHYELNLINHVDKGSWLGERSEPGPGIPGKTVKGIPIPPLPGKVLPLLYDRNTVKEVSEGSRTILMALRSGAVGYQGDRINVSNHLEIGESVDFRTGNIDFDGYITVRGSVEDNFSVQADKDIEVMGEYGVGCVREIESREGSVYIRGGIVGRNKAVIRSRKDLFTKFVSDATIICAGTVHIGYYCLNSNIKAREIIIDSPKGQIIGGRVEADVRIVASQIGSAAEKRTMIRINGFDREATRSRLEAVIKRLEEVGTATVRVKQELSIYMMADFTTLSKERIEYHGKLQDTYGVLKDLQKNLEDEKKILTSQLRAKGSGEVVAQKRIHAGVQLDFAGEIKEVMTASPATTFYRQDRDVLST